MKHWTKDRLYWRNDGSWKHGQFEYLRKEKESRTEQSKLEEEEEKQRKQIAQEIEDELKTKGHVINSENTSINVDTQNGQKESSSNLEKESIPQKEAINNASVDEKIHQG